jgi:hypothetical protein
MSVYINDFEIVSEPAESTGSAEQTAPTPAPDVTPADPEVVVERRERRRKRLRAH